MKYPQLVSTPAVVKEWLEAELEGLGIDSVAYARTVLSLLTRDTLDPAEVIQSGYVIVANKFGRGGPAVPVLQQEEQKRAEVIECLRSASEDQGGIMLLVDQLISMLKQLPPAEEDSAGEQPPPREHSTEPPQCDDPVLRYQAAFPALHRAPGVIPLTYFSRLSAKPRSSAAPPLVSWGGAAGPHPATAVWPTALSLLLDADDALDTLETLPLRLRPGYADSPPAAEPSPPLPLKPPEKPPEAVPPRAIQPSAATHFQPIRRVSGDAEDKDTSPASYEARLYKRSDSGGLYLQDEAGQEAVEGGAERPQKYMVYQEDEPPGRGLAPKFKLSCNEKYCQTDEDDEVASLTGGDGSCERDLLQLLVSGEQAARPRSSTAPLAEAADDDDDDDSSYEVLSSLQATLHSIYEDGSDTAADSEPESSAEPAPPPPPPPPPSAFARVGRAPTGHRPLYLRGGGADSLLAAVYTGVAWSPEDMPAAAEHDHRPLYARQPPTAASSSAAVAVAAAAAAAAGYAEYGQLSSGRISGAVYQQGPTEYPALRYQLAGGGRPEVTFCQLANNTARDDLSAAAASWEDQQRGSTSRRGSAAWPGSGEATSWQTAGDAAPEPLLWAGDAERGGRLPAEDTVLWLARDHSADRSLDTSIWESGRSGSERELSEERGWQPSGADLLETSVEKMWESAASMDKTDTSNVAQSWEHKTKADAQIDASPWDSRGPLTARETTTDESLWESRDENASIDVLAWEAKGNAANRLSDAREKTLWSARIEDCAPGETAAEATLWDALADTLHDKSLGETVWESLSGVAEPSADRRLWESPGGKPAQPPRWSSCAEMVERQWSAEAALWEAPEPAGWDAGLIRAPEQIWRASEQLPTAAETEAETEEQQVRRLLLQLSSGRTGLLTKELADPHPGWEFIDENNVKNKINTLSEVEGGVAAWRVLPALRQLSRCLSFSEGGALPDVAPLQAWALEEQWRRDDQPRRPARERRVRRADRKRPCSFFMEGNCKRTECKFSHDLSAITCVFWEESGCFKGATCPFLHGYPPDDDEEEDAESSDSAKRAVPKKTFKLEKEDFPSLHNTKKLRRNDEEQGSRPAGRRGCRRHKSFSDAPLSVGSGDADLHRTTLGGRGKRRRHHSKSEGVRPADAGARRP